MIFSYYFNVFIVLLSKRGLIISCSNKPSNYSGSLLFLSSFPGLSELLNKTSSRFVYLLSRPELISQAQSLFFILSHKNKLIIKLRKNISVKIVFFFENSEIIKVNCAKTQKN